MKKKGGEVARELLIKIGTEEDEILQKLLKSKKEFKHNQDSLLMEALRFYYHNQQKQSGKITNEIDSKQKFFKPDNATFISYLSRPIKTPYESTKSFFSFLDSIEDLKKSSIIDACCGGGGNLFFLKKILLARNYMGLTLKMTF